jgi:hypothetical protein
MPRGHIRHSRLSAHFPGRWKATPPAMNRECVCDGGGSGRERRVGEGEVCIPYIPCIPYNLHSVLSVVHGVYRHCLTFANDAWGDSSQPRLMDPPKVLLQPTPKS